MMSDAILLGLFMENFKWNSGYSIRYGLYHIDFDNPDLPRTLKPGAYYLRYVIQAYTKSVLTRLKIIFNISLYSQALFLQKAHYQKSSLVDQKNRGQP